MGALWPELPALPARCDHCHRPVSRVNLVAGKYGSTCAEDLGLTVTTPRVRVLPQTGPDLLQLLNEEPEDHCDGYDR